MNLRSVDAEPVALAVVIRNQVEKHLSLNYVEVARVGAVTVSARVAEMAGQVLGGTLTALEHVGTADVQLLADVSREERQLRLEVLAQGVHLHLVVELD